MKIEQRIRYYIAQTLDNPDIDSYFCLKTKVKTISVYISPELEGKAQKLFTILQHYPIGYIVNDLMYGRKLSIYLKQKQV